MDRVHREDIHSAHSGLATPVTRQGALRLAAMAGVSGLMLGLPRAAHADTTGTGTTVSGVTATESLQQIFNVALTAEYLATTFLGNAIANADALGLTPANLQVLKASQAAEADHVNIFQLLGAQPATTTFSFPQGLKTVTDLPTFASTLVLLETTCVAMYLTASGEAAVLGRPDVARLMASLVGVESEHRVLARQLAGLLPPNNVSFETTPFTAVSQAAAAIQAAGFLSPTPGNSFSFPGPVAIDFTGVTARHP